MGKKQSRNEERGARNVERGAGATLKCLPKIKARTSRRRCTLQAEQVGGGGGGICIHMYVYRAEGAGGWLAWLDGMGTTTTTAGVDGTWTAHNFVMLDCAENQLQQQWQQQESGRTQLAKSYIWYTTIVSTLVGTTYQGIDVCVRCATTCTRIYRNRLLV